MLRTMLTPTAAATPDGVSVHANEDLAHARRRVTVTGDMRALRVEALAVGPLTVAGASLTVNGSFGNSSSNRVLFLRQALVLSVASTRRGLTSCNTD